MRDCTFYVSVFPDPQAQSRSSTFDFGLRLRQKSECSELLCKVFKLLLKVFLSTSTTPTLNKQNTTEHQ